MAEPFVPSSALIAFGEYCKRQAKLDDLPDAEHELWHQLADEIDQYINGGQTDQPDLFGEPA